MLASETFTEPYSRICRDIEKGCFKNSIKTWNLIGKKYIESLPVIGGPGIIVDIDESKFGKRKYHRGHRVDGVSVLGMVERTPQRKIILIKVSNRKAETLLPLIKRYIHPESIIYSDGWKGYCQLNDHFFKYETVNHSVTFKDTFTSIHTNTIEGK